MSKKAIQFGAGNIGRGFIGALLVEAGYELVFADVNEEMINELNEKHGYTIHILDLDKREIPVTGVSGCLSNSPEMSKHIAEAEIITTAVGPNVLKFIAVNIAAGLEKRAKTGAGALNIIACENMVGASTHLKEQVYTHLSDEAKAYADEHVGFPNCSVDRIVPPFKGDNLLDVGVESFFEWIVEEPAFKGGVPNIEGMKLTDTLVAYVQRKLFTLNTGHAITAYLGYLKGLPTVDKAIEDDSVRQIVRGAMEESGAALVKEHGFDANEHAKYIDKIEKRFRNPYLNDDVSRVGREPLRKLGEKDRLSGPVRMALGFDLPVDNLLTGIAAALHYNNPEDKQSVELQTSIQENGLEGAIAQATGFTEDSGENAKIADAYESLKK
ncbi:mannitol-1-phosphate 5-dehydrogenase [Saccharibacillus kuerlensis]|uniref:Mannitol-1-phosphate 5-dehydrogenase n=1 Tax=Saccharibacillus kuerlensis TaxID=459527 RepID=A0ABQ2L4C4_9BACL|nr:mannitol-1-phosphate 5-dehydrogenase [Saccharibacillus kuerlensis]GGO00164.1 mannitol-1-phosphate 5-dehydrogenase [Saccharibacillus kuerlensis]